MRFSLRGIMGHTVLVDLVTGEAGLAHLVRAVSVGFPYCKVTVCLSVTNTYLVGSYFDPANVLFLIIPLPTNFCIKKIVLACNSDYVMFI